MISIHSRILVPLSFFLFISYIIFLADTADYNFAFRIVGHIPYGDKIAHALLYGMMAFLLNYGLDFRRGRLLSHHFKPFFAIFGVMAITPYIGSTIVLVLLPLKSQYYIPSRTFDLWDLEADVIGVVLFSLIRIK